MHDRVLRISTVRVLTRFDVKFEDVQWIHPASLEALGRAVERIRNLGVLLIITHLPEFEPPWSGGLT
jgi:predicted ATPase